MDDKITNVEIKVLVDDYAGNKNLISEHGLALFVKTDYFSFIFDTGAGKAIQHNVKKLNVELKTAQALILSHGHYDHTGGIPTVLKYNPEIKIYAHPEFTLERYSIGTYAKYAGIQIHIKKILDKLPSSQMIYNTMPAELAQGVGITGEIPRENSFEDTGGNFFLDKERKHIDLLKDDQALWINTPSGLIIILGCCHSGLVNTLHYIVQITGQKNIFAIIGGMHLLHADRLRIEKTCSVLEQYNIRMLLPCHCTGTHVMEILKYRFPAVFEKVCVGKKFIINF